MKFSKYSRIILLLWGMSIGIVIYYSLVPGVEWPIDFWNVDKVYHAAAYFWLALLSMTGFSVRRALPAALSMVILGALLEIGQYFIPGRTFSLLDIAANSLGVILGIILAHYLRPGSISQRSHFFSGS